MSVYPVIPILNEFGKAINALSKSNGLLKPEKEKLSKAWQDIELTIKAHSNEFEMLKEYESLIEYIKVQQFKKVKTFDPGKKK